MTDKELLELAAKAAGMDCVWNGEAFQYKPRFETLWITWNPLSDDGDALRLAVKLRIEPQFITNKQDKELIWIELGFSSEYEGDVVLEPADPDPYAATRRAIVRAAAEIGRHNLLNMI